MLVAVLITLLVVASVITGIVSLVTKLSNGRVARPIYAALVGWWYKEDEKAAAIILADSIASGSEEFGWRVSQWDYIEKLESDVLKTWVRFDQDGLARVTVNPHAMNESTLKLSSYEDYRLYKAASTLRHSKKTGIALDAEKRLLANFNSIQRRIGNK